MKLKLMTIICMISLAAACANDETASDLGGFAPENTGGGNTGVGQSGAQDFGRFRAIIDRGELPSPETLDMVGFFNEHKVELPNPECEQSICLHAQFGVQGNMINGASCNIVLLGMNTALQPSDYERPPLNLAIAVDTSGSMSGQPIEDVRNGLLALVEQLDPKDTITLVRYQSTAEVATVSSPSSDPERTQLRSSILGLNAGGSTNIYEGLRLALESTKSGANDALQNRVILLSDGVATSGIMDSGRIINLGASYAEQGIGITTIGVGTEFDQHLMQSLSETGPGNFYFLEDSQAVEEVFVEEATSFLVPLAQDVSIAFAADSAYEFRAAYGTNDWTGGRNHATIDIDSLFMASRQTIDDLGQTGGRRGGGGMILLELTPSSLEAEAAQFDGGVGQVMLRFRPPGSEEYVTQTVEVQNPLELEAAPEDGAFDSPAVEKGFVTLNIFVGFQMATQRAEAGSPDAALNVLSPLIVSVEEWLETNDDVDIENDLEYLRKLEQVILQRGASTERIGQAPNPWPRD